MPHDHRPQAPARASRRRVGQLGPAEQFLLWSLRSGAAEGRPGPRIQQEFFFRFGLVEVDGALCALEDALDVLARAGRRVLVVGCTACDRISLDEEAIIALFAALQAGDRGYARAAAPWLVGAAGIETLVTAVGDLARTMARHDLPLPWPAAGPTLRPAGSPPGESIQARPVPRSGRRQAGGLPGG